MTKSNRLLIFIILSIFVGITQVAFAQDGIITLPSDSLAVGETKVIDVGIVCSATDCAAIDITIQYDPAVISVDAAEAGGFWSQTGNVVFPVTNAIDPVAGTVHFASVTINGGNPGVTGSGSAVRLTVTGLADGTSALNVTNLQLGSLSGAAVSSIPANGSLSVVSDTTPSISMESDRTEYTAGETITVRVNANNMTDAYGIALDCDINKSIIAGQSVELGSLFDPTNNLPVNLTHLDDNSWDFGAAQRNPAPAMNGSGLAFTLTFLAQADGTAQLNCTPKVSDTNIQPIDVSFSGISLQIGEVVNDTDGDGIPDVDDQCPTEGDLGNGIDANGCPYKDDDSDGVFNRNDACPTEGDLGLGVDADGCPYKDDDSDGVFNRDDLCPTEGDLGLGVDADGCPYKDGDSDGVFDRNDLCPTEGDLGLGVDADGCPITEPDTDSDGVPDSTDLCPTEGDLGNGVDADGCPIPVAVETGRFISFINDLPVGATVRLVNTVDSAELVAVIADDGTVTIEDVPVGTYDAVAEAPQHLTAVASAIVIVANEDYVLGPVTLLNGDVTNDGIIDSADAGLVGISYNQSVPPIPAEYDLTNDSIVDIFDMTVIGVNWFKEAPQPWQ